MILSDIFFPLAGTGVGVVAGVGVAAGVDVATGGADLVMSATARDKFHAANADTVTIPASKISFFSVFFMGAFGGGNIVMRPHTSF
ncbi:MAG TPA: hypothetical protein VF719_03580 [Abditibacteriaceae bacterium]